MLRKKYAIQPASGSIKNLAEAKELFQLLIVGDHFRVSGHPGSSPKNKIEGRVEGKRVSIDLAFQTFHYAIHVK
jgi:hypothetical protein